jgi:hypothetical protein
MDTQEMLQEIDAGIADLMQVRKDIVMLGNGGTLKKRQPAAKKQPHPSTHISPAGRKRLSELAKQQWAAKRAAKGNPEAFARVRKQERRPHRRREGRPSTLLTIASGQNGTPSVEADR